MAVLKLQIKGKSKNAKRQPTENNKNIKTKIIIKYTLSGGLFFTFSWPAESNRSSTLPSVTPLQQTLRILIKQNDI